MKKNISYLLFLLVLLRSEQDLPTTSARIGQGPHTSCSGSSVITPLMESIPIPQ
jgi:hypothetical protein